MLKFLIPVAAALGLMACTQASDGSYSGPVQFGEADLTTYAQFALGQVRTYNALGYDPLRLDEDKLNLMVALCGTVVGAMDAGLITVESVQADEVLQFCEVAIIAAGPAEGTE